MFLFGDLCLRLTKYRAQSSASRLIRCMRLVGASGMAKRVQIRYLIFPAEGRASHMTTHGFAAVAKELPRAGIEKLTPTQVTDRCWSSCPKELVRISWLF